MKIGKKKIIGIGVAVVFVAALGYVVFLNFVPDYDIWQLAQNMKKFEQGVVSGQKNDTFGGKTPEETYNLYVAALKNGDLDAASKYFYWDRQDKEKTRLDDLKSRGELEKYIDDLPKWGEMKEEEYWDKDGKQFSYNFVLGNDRVYFDELIQKTSTLEAGSYKSTIIFEINKYSNIWKIYSF